MTGTAAPNCGVEGGAAVFDDGVLLSEKLKDELLLSLLFVVVVAAAELNEKGEAPLGCVAAPNMLLCYFLNIISL